LDLKNFPYKWAGNNEFNLRPFLYYLDLSKFVSSFDFCLDPILWSILFCACLLWNTHVFFIHLSNSCFTWLSSSIRKTSFFECYNFFSFIGLTLSPSPSFTPKRHRSSYSNYFCLIDRPSIQSKCHPSKVSNNCDKSTKKICHLILSITISVNFKTESNLQANSVFHVFWKYKIG
jgi:hypothetical protein